MNSIFKLMILAFLPVISGCEQHAKKPEIKNKQPEPEVVKRIRENELVFNSADPKELLGRLFDNPEFDAAGMALWKPNYYERLSFPVSYDGKCHTAVDTVMYYNDRQNRKCAVVILTTYKYYKDESDSTSITVSDCHFCGVPIGIALLARVKNNQWELYKFEKAFTTLGYFGVYKTGREDAGKISLKTIGDQWTCLSLIQGVGGNMGEFSGSESLYSVEEFQLGGFPNAVLSEILNYDYHFEYTSIDEKTKERTDVKMKIIKKKKEYYDIELNKVSNGQSTSTVLSYSEEYNRYIEKQAGDK